MNDYPAMTPQQAAAIDRGVREAGGVPEPGERRYGDPKAIAAILAKHRDAVRERQAAELALGRDLTADERAGFGELSDVQLVRLQHYERPPEPAGVRIPIGDDDPLEKVQAESAALVEVLRRSVIEDRIAGLQAQLDPTEAE